GYAGETASGLARLGSPQSADHSSSRRSLLALGRSWLALLNAIQDEGGITFCWSIFDATDENERRAVLIAAIDRAFAAAELPSLDIIAEENFAADLDALRVRLAAARIERLLVGVHFTSPLCVKR